MLNLISLVLLVVFALPIAYLYLLALGSVRHRPVQASQAPCHRFAFAIPAHNEETVIGSSVSNLHKMNYPPNMFGIYVVADHCTDDTADVARASGATVYERTDGPRGSKGAALNWLLPRVFDSAPLLGTNGRYDAVIILDADTRVDPSFLRVMDARLTKGDIVIQGQHRISNPDDGWFPALVSAMFIVDNRFQNEGRSNLGLSAKHMGDSICFRSNVVKRLQWGEGLTEDYECRQRLLLEGIKITYEPGAIGRGEAPMNWRVARGQRARWLRGSYRASRRFAPLMLKEGLRRRDRALLDGALQAFLPSYSTLTLLSALLLLAQLLFSSSVSRELIYASAALVLSLLVYPLIGLVFEHASWRMYFAILLGPVFVIWRTGLSVYARWGKPVTWVRTERRRTVTTARTK